MPNINILVVGSTTTVQDEALCSLLRDEGIIVFRRYIPRIEELYQLADYYVFPVQRNDAAIETPLSVLEAMATNLPVLTTKFGSLADTFQEDEHFKFINGPNDIVTELKKGFSTNRNNNRERIASFTWDAVADRIAEMIQ